MIARSSPGSAFPREVGRSVFGTDVRGYHDIRPGYPEELFRLIGDRLSGRDVFGEIGPGTGLATSGLLELKPKRLIAFEPDRALANFLGSRFPAIEVNGDDFCAAEIDASFDLIASASSFHWLDPSMALQKAYNLLPGGGWIAIWWNVYRQTGIGDPFAEAIAPLLLDIDLPPSQSATHHYGLDRDFHFNGLRGAGFTDLEYHLFRRERILTPAEARALYSSFSLVRILPEQRREGLLDRIANVVADEFDGAAPSTLLTPLYLARKKPL